MGAGAVLGVQIKGSSRKVRERNRQEPNEHEEERMVVIIVSKALDDFDLVIKSLQFAGRYRIDDVSNQAIYAGMSPSTYQSGQLSLSGAYSHMEKRGSRYLRYALFNATKYVCLWDPTFAAYLAKKRAEGKHYNVAVSHATKKLVRLIYAVEKSRLPYCNAA